MSHPTSTSRCGRASALLLGTALALALAPIAWPAGAADFVVGSVPEMLAEVGSLGPGDRLILADGTYSDFSLTVGNSGTATQRVTVQAQNPGQVTFSGDINISLSGSYITLQDFAFRNGGVGPVRNQLIYIGGSHNRVTGCDFDSFNQGNVPETGYSWIYSPGNGGNQSNRVDHCSFAGKTSGGTTVFFFLSGFPALQNHRIDHNYFSRPPLGYNGGSAVRVGSGTLQPGNPDWIGGTTIEHNLFDHSDGENEIITVKSSRNTIRHNTFLNSEGRLSLRHGHDNLVQSNFFLQTDGTLPHADGVAVRGDGHEIRDNYFENLLVDNRAFFAAIAVYAGVSTNIDALHEVAESCTIEGNTVVHSRNGFALSLKADLGTSGKNLLPSDITIENNTFLSDGHTVLADDPGNANLTWTGNTAWGGPVGLNPVLPGVTVQDPGLARDTDGILRPGSPAGAPLTIADVGPAWLTTKPGLARFVRPEDGGTGVDVSLLQWTDGGGATGHRIHFGATTTPPLVVTQTGLMCNAGALLPNTSYYWRIDEVNSEGTTTGVVWEFTTGPDVEDAAYKAWRLQYFTQAEIDAGMADAGYDADGDGPDNGEEYIADTDPRSEYSFLAVDEISVAASGDTEITFESSAHRQYGLGWSTNPVAEVWEPLVSDQPGTGGAVTVADSNRHDACVYRLSATLP